MKKFLPTLTVSLLTFTFTACGQNTPADQQPDTATEPPTNSYQKEEPLDAQETAKIVISLLKNKNLNTMAKLVHPEKGLRFSPYVNVNPSTNRKLTTEEVRTAFEGDTIYYWGIYDGSGEPINFTFEKYYNRFVYGRDFAASTEISISTTELRTYGNIIDNTFDIYPGATVVQYYLPGTNPEYGGMDWQSLRLVFEKEGETWYLVGIIHDEWTT